MKSRGTAIALLLCLGTFGTQTLAANVIQMTFSKRDPTIEVASQDVQANLLERATPIEQELINNITGGSYMTDVTVGTPPQPISLVIDTGSSDTFVLADFADQCSDASTAYLHGPCVGGVFDLSASSTYNTITTNGFRISYADKTGSSGDYFSDDFEIGGAKVSALQMGLAINTTVGVGIMGIGYTAGESVTAKLRYPNLVDQLVAQKLINLKAYSLWLNDKESTTGNVLFGGIDTAKFVGTLKVIPVRPDIRTNTIRSFTVYLTGLSVTDDSGSASALTNSSFTLPVILDSGTTISYLPQSILDSIVNAIGGFDDQDRSGYTFVDCDWRTTRQNSYLSFTFGANGGPVINVPLSEVIRTLSRTYSASPFKRTCSLGIRAANPPYLFGDTFLRSAYVVYDIDHNQIALAQTNFEAPDSNVQEIPASATGVPLLTGKASGQTVVPQSHFTTGKTSSTRNQTSATSTASSATSGVQVNTRSATGAGSGSSPTGTGAQSFATPKNAAVGSMPAFERSGLVVFAVSVMLALADRSWFLA